MNAEIAQLEQAVLDAKEALRRARRSLPPAAIRDYDLKMAGSGTPVKLSQLFGRHDELIIIHNMGRSCPYCTLWADGFVGLYPHLADRAAFVLTTPDDPFTAADFASSRGWPFPVVSIAGTSFASDLGYADAKHPALPGASALRRSASGELARTGTAPFGPGDDFCSVWPLLDLLPAGSKTWSPKYSYSAPAGHH